MYKQEINLLDYQIEQLTAIKKIHDKSFIAVDYSRMGTGKTFPALKYAEEFPQSLVISSAAVINGNWIGQVAANFIIPKTMEFITLEKLRGFSERELNHEYLVRQEIERNRKTIVRYFPSKKWAEMCQEGILLIIDEMQFVKNQNLQAKAIKAMIAELKKYNSSRVLMLSGSIIDDTAQAKNYFSLLGILTLQPMTINPSSKKKAYPGILEIEEFCNHERKCIIEKPLNYIEHIFMTTFKQNFCCAMKPPQLRDMFKFNWFCKVSQTNDQEIGMAVSMIDKIIKSKKINQTMIFALMQRIEVAKVPTFIRLARKFFAENATGKLVIGLGYLEGIRLLEQELAEFSPAVITGCVPNKSRQEIIEHFQKPDLSSRLIIAQVRIISTGITLHDAHGNFPRTCYISPSYDTMMIFQIGHRFCRITTKSTPDLRVIYSKNNKHELTVISRLARKSEIMAQFHSDGVGCLFPHEFTEITE